MGITQMWLKRVCRPSAFDIARLVPELAGRSESLLFTRRALVFAGLSMPAMLLRMPVATALAAPTGLVRDVRSYQQALSHAARSSRHALIDVRADWCAVCHRIERDILTHPLVRQYLEHVALIKVDVTAMDEGNRQLLSYLRASGPPTFFVVDTSTGREFSGTRSVGPFNHNDLVRRLHPFAQGS
jgi:thiol:disulfide interchange protein